MMKNLKVLIGFLILATFSIDFALSVKCYTCSTDPSDPTYNPNCADPFKAAGIPTNADSSTNTCIKEIVVQNGATNIRRLVSPTGTCNTITCTGLGGFSSSAYFCSSDLCNGASKLNNFSNKMVALTLMAIIYFFTWA